MRAIKILSLVLFMLLALLSIFGVGKILIVDGYPKETFLKKNPLEVIENIVNPNLTKDPVSITIGSETIELENPAFVLIEDKDGNVVMISGKRLEGLGAVDFPQSIDNISNKKDGYSFQNLILETATASSNAYAGHKCRGPYVNSNGEVVPRTCESH